MTNTDLTDYYARRAADYDEIYRKPERQQDIATLASRLTELLAGRSVLEIACGTGFWTQFVAKQAAGITATDINEEVLAIARARLGVSPNVSVSCADAFGLENVGQAYDGALAAFWWSHLRRNQVRQFLIVLHGRLVPGALVVFADNRYVEGSSTPIARTDSEGNTYQLRRLKDGSEHEVLKNFPAEGDFLAAVEGLGADVTFAELTYFWYASYRVVG